MMMSDEIILERGRFCVRVFLESFVNAEMSKIFDPATDQGIV